jgi:hypothetical protein
MGIAGFFYTWLRSQNLIGTSLVFDIDVALKDIPSRKYRSLSLDIPGIIHESAQKTWCYGSCSRKTKVTQDEQQLREIFYGEVFSRILNIVKLFHNGENKLDVLIIALDGKAPVAKMNEQRSRRFISKQDNPSSPFDSAQISPGTDFMSDLDEKLYEWIGLNVCDGANSEKPLPSSVIYSSCFSSGEAEHKIMEYYRSQTNTEGSHILYGSDNDLILLSLASPLNGIIVMREEKEREKEEESSYQIMGGTSEEVREQQLKRARYNQRGKVDLGYSRTYVDIDKFKQLLKELGMQLRDYVLMMNLVGNDFLPTQPIFEIKSDVGWKALFDIYRETRDILINERKISETEDILVRDGDIIWENLLLILKRMAILEQGSKRSSSLVIDNSKELLKRGYGFFGLKDLEPTDFTKFRQMWYSYKIFNDVEYKVNYKGRGKAKTETIEEVRKYPADMSSEEFKLEVKKICLEYLKCLNWVNHYYVTGNVDWYFYYPYKYTPLVIDVFSVLKTLIETQNYGYINDVYADPEYPKGDYGLITQLISILPKQSFYLLPTPLDVLPDTELKELFPDIVDVDKYKARDYQRIVKIPNVNIDLVYQVTNDVITDILRVASLEMHEEDIVTGNFYETYLAQLKEQDDIIFNHSEVEIDWNLRNTQQYDINSPEKQKRWEPADVSDKRIELVYYEDPGIRWRLNSVNFIDVSRGQVNVPYNKLTDSNRPEIVKTISDMIKNGTIKFPYSKYFMKKPEVLIQNKTEAKFVVYPKWEFDVGLEFFDTEEIEGNVYPKVVLYKDSDYEKIDIITNWFTEEPRAEAIFTTYSRKHRRNMIEGFHDEAEFVTSKAFMYAVNHRMNLDTKALSEGIYLSRDRVPSCTTFKVSVAIVINNIFKSKVVFDPFAGWGDRAVGAIMSDTCVKYIGTDPNSKLWKGHSKIRLFLESTYPGKKVIFSHSPIEDFLYEAYFEDEKDRPDLIFSGPPYFDYEIYSTEETQSHVKYNTPEKWQQWLNENTKKAFSYLKVGSYLVYYLAKCGNINIPKMLKEYMKQNVSNSEYSGLIPITKEGGRPLFCHVWKKTSAS